MRTRTALITIFATLIIDQWLKIWVKSNALIGEVVFEAGILNIQFIENPGMAFGWELGGVWGKLLLSSFRIIAIIGIGFVIRNLIENKVHKGLVFSAALVFAGALGNLLDSAFYGLMFDQGTIWNPEINDWAAYHGVAEMNYDGYTGFLQGCVVDMIHIKFNWPSWMPFDLAGTEVFPPIFNIADMAVSTGVITMLVFNKRFFGEGKGDFSIFRRKKKTA